jgi:hypothetical protein
VFRATFTETLGGTDERQPDVGDQARVKFHAGSQKVRFDRSVPREDAKASPAADRIGFDAIANSPAG